MKTKKNSAASFFLVSSLGLFAAFLLSTVSCTTPSSQNLIKASHDSNIYRVSKMVNDLCLNSHNPQFLADFSSSDLNSNFQLEGVWKDNYTTLNMQVLGVFGEQYAYFSLNNHIINLSSSRKDILDNVGIKNLVDFISSLGARDLRKLFCGSYAFNQEKTDSIFVKDIDKIKDGLFFSRNDMEIDNHTIDVQSELKLTDSVDNDSYELSIQSHFLYGIFGLNSNFEIEWKGHVKERQVYPKTIAFNDKKNKYKLKILDYD